MGYLEKPKADLIKILKQLAVSVKSVWECFSTRSRCWSLSGVFGCQEGVLCQAVRQLYGTHRRHAGLHLLTSGPVRHQFSTLAQKLRDPAELLLGPRMSRIAPRMTFGVVAATRSSKSWRTLVFRIPALARDPLVENKT